MTKPRVSGYAIAQRRTTEALRELGLTILPDWHAAVDRVLSRVVEVDGCWEWQGARNAAGYGKMHLPIEGRVEYVHRIMLKAQGISLVGLESCHKCDNPRCCNPQHLFAGTRIDNARDCRNKGRQVVPSCNWAELMPRRKHHWQRLSAEEIVTIRARALAGEKRKSIAADFGIKPDHVGQIARGLRGAWA